MAAKRQFALQRVQRQHATPASHHERFGYDDIEPEDEGRSDFPCPYCYEDHDITSLCTHLEDEHPFESKVVVSSVPSNCVMCFFYLACNIWYVYKEM
ncbi:Protein DEHYDRATION-INDUCED 19-like protein 4 [Dichanthelium oligosanthes]|uniref:Protein DEHYDRATION-INDUCED 19-like protein 4 n=1 Tax=Dichanthelium oligosanthes TaxID=888268 RepID=A0A1E5WK70_9POAL|nr:Protein DEHYDRATION-INDUCED 19-like protein 4 [Dichanthelium oligosanthes]